MHSISTLGAESTIVLRGDLDASKRDAIQELVAGAGDHNIRLDLTRVPYLDLSILCDFVRLRDALAQTPLTLDILMERGGQIARVFELMDLGEGPGICHVAPRTPRIGYRRNARLR